MSLDALLVSPTLLDFLAAAAGKPPATVLGMRVIPHPLLRRRRFELAPGDYISEEFRAKHQAWCDEFFGFEDFVVIADPSAITGRIREEPFTVEYEFDAKRVAIVRMIAP